MRSQRKVFRFWRGQIVVFTRHITERKQVEEALRQSEEKYRTIFEFTREAIIVSVPSGRILSANPAAAAILGYDSPQELVGMLGAELYVDLGQRKAVQAALLSKGYIEDMELTLKKKDGTPVHVLGSSTIHKDQQGKPLRVESIWMDITERKKAEESLRQSEEKLRVMFQTVAEGIVVTDLEGNILDVNEAAARQGGHSKEETTGRNLFEITSPKERARAMKNLKRLMTEEHHGPVEYAFLRKDGTEFPGEVNTCLIRDASGNPAGFIAVTRDITERKRMEAQLKEYSENLERLVEVRTRELEDAQEKLVRTEKLAAIGQLAGGVGHELRNPLAAIKTSAYFLKMKLGNTAEEKVVKHLDMLENQVDACDKIINDLLDFSRPGRSNIGEVDINQVVQELVKTIGAPENVEVSTSLAADPAKVMADSGQLERVFSNLISNAIQAMPGGGRLSLSTSRNGGFVKVKVADTGVGIPPENLDKVFEPLFTTRAKGTGLGLAIARALAERQGGIIEVESQVGKGTTFTVRLPVAGKEV